MVKVPGNYIHIVISYLTVSIFTAKEERGEGEFGVVIVEMKSWLADADAS